MIIYPTKNYNSSNLNLSLTFVYLIQQMEGDTSSLSIYCMNESAGNIIMKREANRVAISRNAEQVQYKFQ